MLNQSLPALLLLGLLQATQPALATGLVPLCTAGGTRWINPDGTPADRDDNPATRTCAHGWAEPRRPKLVV